jgi:hypothetical protein
MFSIRTSFTGCLDGVREEYKMRAKPSWPKINQTIAGMMKKCEEIKVQHIDAVVMILSYLQLWL